MKKDIAIITKTPAARAAFCEETTELEAKIGQTFIELGRRLMLIREHKLYADQHDSFEEYLAEFRSINESTASKLITIYAVLVVKFKISPRRLAKARGWTHLYAILELLKNKKQAVEWLAKAETLTRTDLQREITEAKSGKPQAECKHAESAFLKVCLSGCGLKERVSALPAEVQAKTSAQIGSYKGAAVVIATTDKATIREAKKDFKKLQALAVQGALAAPKA